MFGDVTAPLEGGRGLELVQSGFRRGTLGLEVFLGLELHCVPRDMFYKDSAYS